MMRQAFDLLRHLLSSERFKGLDNAGMQHTPPLLQEATIDDLVGEGMLEGECALGEELGLIEKLGGLQVGQATLEHLLEHLGNGVHEQQGHLGANHGRCLQEALVLRR